MTVKEEKQLAKDLQIWFDTRADWDGTNFWRSNPVLKVIRFELKSMDYWKRRKANLYKTK